MEVWSLSRVVLPVSADTKTLWPRFINQGGQSEDSNTNINSNSNNNITVSQ